MGASPSSGHPVRLGVGIVRVRDLVGADERSVDATDSAAARALVDRLLVDAPGVIAGAGEAEQLTVAERDRVLAHVYARTFGDRVAGVGVCDACEERYDLDFSLRDVLGQLPVPGRQVQLPGGARLRVPTGADEQALQLAEPDDAGRVLLVRCLEEGDPDALDPDRVAEALQSAAPMLDFDASAPCPSCGHDNTVRFDLQAWLLGALLRERRRLFSEIHLLARAYGWSLDAILSLGRDERRTLVALVDSGSAA